jgi:ABC-type antimicrobial peptide transport system permease subunit
MKLGLYLKYATRALARGGQRTVLAVFCVTIGVLALVAMQLVGTMVNASLTGNIRDLNGGDLTLTDVRLTADQLAYFDQLEVQGAISAYTAVAATQGSAQGQHPVARIDSILAVDPARFPLAGAPTFEAPSDATNATLNAALAGTSIALTHDLAQRLGVSAGDTCILNLADGHPASVRVGGVIANTGLFQQPQILLAFDTYAALRTPGAPPLRYDAVYADVPGHGAAQADAVKNDLLTHFDNGLVLTTSVLLDQNRQQVHDIRAFLNVAGLVALLIGGMGIVNTMQVLLRRRRTEIAMLKTSGYTRRDLYVLFGLEAALIGLLGGALGAALGAGASLLVRPLFEHAFSLELPVALDPLTLGLGILMGGVIALIFGLLPIVRASQVRPSAVLREQPEGARAASRVGTLLLGLALVALVFALTWSILQDANAALSLILGAGAALVLLGLAFTLVVAIVSRLPAALLPLPRAWRGHLTLALRNFGRQRARTVSALVGLFVGVFAVGLILVVGQGVEAQYVSAGNTINATLGVQPLAYEAVERQVEQTPQITRHETYAQAGYQLLMVNNGTPGHEWGGAMLGLDLAHGQAPSSDITLDGGRMLDANDAGTHNAVLSPDQTDPALGLKVGDTITVEQTTKFNGPPPNAHRVTLTIVGLYTNHGTWAERAGNLLVDSGVVMALDPDHYFDLVTVHVDPSTADSVLTQFVTDYPQSVFIHNYADAFAQFETFFNNLILLLEAVVLPALLAAVIIVANGVALALLERRRELGILKAVGYTSRGVLAEVLIEQGLGGLAAGALAMLVVALLVAAVVGAVVGKAVTPTAIQISPLMVGIVASSAVLCMLVAAAVAWRATRIRPLAVLRYE